MPFYNFPDLQFNPQSRKGPPNGEKLFYYLKICEDRNVTRLGAGPAAEARPPSIKICEISW